MTTKLDGYVRVSRVNGRSGDSFISPARQREAISAWAKANGVEIVAWHEELDRSGGAGKRRPVFEALLKRVTDGDSGGVVVWKYSRFGRSLIESALRIRTLEEARGKVRSATEGQDKLTRNIMLVIAEDELDRITDSWRDSQSRAIKRGVWIGPTPLGYRRTILTNENGKEYNGPLEPSDEAPIVTEAYELAASEGLHAAGAYLTEKMPDKRWLTSDVRRLLRSRAYLGEVRLGKLVYTDDDGKLVAHTPLTTPTLYELAQTKPKAKRTSGDYPLTQIARCATCESGLVGALQSVHGRTYRRMRCSNVDCATGCSINADKLEDYVRERLGGALGTKRFRDRFQPKGAAGLKQAWEQAESELEEYMTDPPISPDRRSAYRAGAQVRERAADEAKAAYLEAMGREASVEELPGADQLADPAKFRAALRGMVSRVVVHPGAGRGPRVPIGFRATLLTVLDGDEVAWPFPA